MKKILLVLCILLLASPSWAVEAYFSHEYGSFTVSELEGFPGQTENISHGNFSPTTLPLIEGIIGQIAPVKFEADVDMGSSVFGWYEFKFSIADVSEINYSLIQDNANNIFNYIRPILHVEDGIEGTTFDVYGYLVLHGMENTVEVTVTQDVFLIKIPMLFSDRAPSDIAFERNYLHIFDGNADGCLSISSYIGIKASLSPDIKPEPGTVVLDASKLKLKFGDIDSFLELEKAEADFEYLGETDWPGHEDVLGAISIGSFEGTYSGAGGYAPLDIEIIITADELSGLSSDGYNAIVSSWDSDKTTFFNYFHVYKQIIGTGVIEDLVTMGGKNVFALSGDPSTEITISFPMILIDDAGSCYYSEDVGFVIYDGERDGKLVDPLFVGALKGAEEPTGPDEPYEPEEPKDDEDNGDGTKHLLPGGNPTGSSTGHDDLDKWIKIFSLF